MPPEETSVPKKRRGALATTANVLAYILVSVVFLVFLAVILVQTPPVQNFVRGKVQNYLEKKLKTRVEIGKLNIHFPNSVTLKNVFFEDQTKDTLLSGGELKVDLDMFKLLRNEVQIKNLIFNDITTKIKRVGRDTVFNFQFVVNAFASDQKKDTLLHDSTTIKMNVDNIVFNNTRVIYQDVITGDDLDLFFTHLDAPIKTFDPTHLYFDIPTFTLTGLKGYYYQNQPLKPKIDSALAQAVLTPGNTLLLKNSSIILKDIDVDYKSVPTNIATTLKFKGLTAHPDTLHIKEGKFDFKDMELDSADISVTMSNATKAPPVTAKQLLVKEVLPLFTITSDDVKISRSNFILNNISMPVLHYGMDYGHLDVRNINFSARKMFYNSDTLYANITSSSMNEKSGFVLNEFTGHFLYTNRETSLKDFYIKTPGSLLRNKAVINYPSLEKFIANPAVMNMDLDIQSSHVLVRDILMFAPMLRGLPAFAHPDQTVMLNGRIKGSMADLHFYDFRLQGLGQTTLFVSGGIKGLPDPNKFSADLDIKYLKTTKGDILSFLPKNSLPATITLPETISATGKIRGNMQNMVADLDITTSLGSAKIKGTVANMTNPKTIVYDLATTANNLNIGALMQNPNIGIFNGSIKARGKGFDPATANASFNGTISSIIYNQYNYKNVRLEGSIANKLFNVHAAIHDPNIDLTVTANGSFETKYPAIHFVANIDSIKTMPLHFTPQNVIYHGNIAGDLTSSDPDHLAGNVLITHSILVNENERVELDSIRVIAEHTNGIETITFISSFATASISGQYKLTQLADVFQQTINPYFSMGSKVTHQKVDPYDFTIKAQIFDNPAIRTFAPLLKRLDSVNINANFSSQNGINANISAPAIVYGTYRLFGLNINAVTKNNQIEFTTSFRRLRSGSSVSLYATSLSGNIANNNINFFLNTKDRKKIDKYRLAASLKVNALDSYTFNLHPDSLLLNYQKWSVNPSNSIQYTKSDIVANQFVLSQGSQQLSINSLGAGTNRPLNIDFTNFSIATIAAFVQSDSMFVNGLMNGNILLKNYMTQPAFTTDLTVNDLSVNQDTLGNLVAKVNNNVQNVFETHLNLTGHDNEVNVDGNYFLKPANQSSFDFTLDIARLQLKSLEGVSMGQMSSGSGNLSGKIFVKGTVAKPDVNGQVAFNNTSFVITQLNTRFKVDNEIIKVDNGGFTFDTFTIKDADNNDLVINGKLNTTDFMNYGLDLTVDADNFQAINTTKKANQLFYGQMYISTSLQMSGTLDQPVVDGSIRVNDRTKFSVVLPQAEPSIVEREGIVRFVDLDKTPMDSLFMVPYDSLNTSSLIGYNISANIEIDKEAEFNFIVDAGNGDFIKVKGEASLTGGIDPSGKITLVGAYELNEGAYELSFNFIKRKFNIQKGSRIVWSGEPTSADIDISAVYIAEASPLDLVQNQLSASPTVIKNTYRQKLPFEVHLYLRGQLLQPDITFDVILPEDKNYIVSKEIISNVQARLLQLREEPSELNKQVFALLLLNRFVNENPFDNSNGGMDPGAFAKQSVSKLLTEQLNQLAGGLIEGVDINFDLTTASDYTTGEKRDRTDFNIGITKRLLGDRLTVSVGSNFELEGPKPTNQKNNSNNLAGNIALDYKISRDGRYVLRAYRKNEYEGIIEGYIVETGLGFIINVDYNHFREIFQRSKQRKASLNTTNTTPSDNKMKITPPVKPESKPNKK
ncbi:MAG: translocation/assembly module TamB domain-containing protein [Ginsengibacter sp.]